MANIGSFTKSGESYKGEIVTMSVQTKNVRIVPEEASENENAPTHRVFVGRAEIGAAWTKTSNEGRNYLSVMRCLCGRPSPSSFRVAWTERRYRDGSLAETSRWSAILTVSINPPRTPDAMRKNPLGLFIDAINWSKELGS